MKATQDWIDYHETAYAVERSTTNYAPLSHYTAEYRQWGAGPPLVLVPGLAGGVGLVTPLAQQLAGRFQVTSYQLRGEEDCFAVRRRFGLEELGRDLAEFIEYLNLERPIVVGVSFGAALAMEFAARCPWHLSGLVAQGIDVRFQPTLLREIAGRVLSGYPLPHDSPFVNQFFHLLFGGKQNDRNLFDFVTRQCWQTDQSVMAHRFHLAETLDLTGKLEHIEVPTLLMSGERDLLVSAIGLREIVDTVPHLRQVSIKSAGHLAFVTRPAEIARHVFDFAVEEDLIPTW